MVIMCWDFYLIFVGLICVTKCEQNCDHLGTLLYEDIGCSAVYKDGKDCPIKFDCEDFTSNNDTCVFRGRRYNVSEELEDNLTFDNCLAACRCYDPTSDEKYVCAVLDCPEWFGDELEEGCYRKYDVDKCCSTGSICPNKEKVKVCEFQGHRYKEGELFFPKNTCNKCSCQKGFQGKTETPFCKRNLCSIQLLHSDKLENFCAPVYFHQEDEKALCCPNDWVCPSSSDEVVILPQSNSNTDLTCKFGSTSLKLGDRFDYKVDFYGKERNVSCECILPPLVTCEEN